MTETIIGLLRHGQTDWNIDFRLQGTTDIPLNEVGINQAHAVAAHLSPTDWDALAASPLSRARDTAAIITQVSQLPEAKVEPLLMERAFGVGEGLTYEQWREQFKDLAEIPGGESLVQLADRVWELLNHLLSEYRGKRLLTVSHGALIRKIIELVSDNTLPHPGDRFGNTSLTVIAHNEHHGWHVLNYNPHPYEGRAVKKEI